MMNPFGFPMNSSSNNNNNGQTTNNPFASMNMAIGAGHDFTVGMLIDEAGDDRYDAPNLSLVTASLASSSALFRSSCGTRNSAGTILLILPEETFTATRPMH